MRWSCKFSIDDSQIDCRATRKSLLGIKQASATLFSKKVRLFLREWQIFLKSRRILSYNFFKFWKPLKRHNDIRINVFLSVKCEEYNLKQKGRTTHYKTCHFPNPEIGKRKNAVHVFVHWLACLLLAAVGSYMNIKDHTKARNQSQSQ